MAKWEREMLQWHREHHLSAHIMGPLPNVPVTGAPNQTMPATGLPMIIADEPFNGQLQAPAIGVLTQLAMPATVLSSSDLRYSDGLMPTCAMGQQHAQPQAQYSDGLMPTYAMGQQHAQPQAQYNDGLMPTYAMGQQHAQPQQPQPQQPAPPTYIPSNRDPHDIPSGNSSIDQSGQPPAPPPPRPTPIYSYQAGDF